MTNSQTFERYDYVTCSSGIPYRIEEVGDGWVSARVLGTETQIIFGDHPHAHVPMTPDFLRRTD